MTKDERLTLITKYIQDENTVEETINSVVEQSGVTEKTIKADILFLFPDTVFPEVKEKEEAKEDALVLKFKPEGNKEMVKGRVTKYKIELNEQGHVHVELEKTQFDSGAGLKVSTPFVQIFDTIAWRQFAPNAKGLGYKYIKVLYAPKGVDKTIPAPKKVNK